MICDYNNCQNFCNVKSISTIILEPHLTLTNPCQKLKGYSGFDPMKVAFKFTFTPSMIQSKRDH